MNRYFYILLFFLLALTEGLQAQEIRRYETFKFSDKSYSYAYYLPDGFDESKTYPALIGPGEGVKGSDKCYFWNVDNPGKFGWILIEFSFWKQNSNVVEALLKHLNEKFNIEGDKFHIVGFSANSASSFGHVISNPKRN